MNGTVRCAVIGNTAFVSFDRPDLRIAMTFGMYEELEAACTAIRSDSAIRTAVFRGVGGQAFVAGTDIQQFRAFETAADGLTYETRIDAVIDAVESLPVPTVAVIEGFAMGGGFAIAIACDLRIATPDAKFGYPIARTLGNCLSMANTERLVANFGPSLAKRILLMADSVDAKAARDAHFLLDIVERKELDARIASICERLAGHAPLTIRAAKEAIRRNMLLGVADGADIIDTVYGSADFHRGVEGFLAKKRPAWTGK